MCDVPLIIEAQALEEQDVLAHIAIFGSPDPPMVRFYLFSTYLDPEGAGVQTPPPFSGKITSCYRFP